jgi:hypothetical protein
MSNAREKLREAKYFLDRMRETRPDRDPFKYNLSAFLSAARSVRYVMEAEYGKSPGFMTWWNSKKEWVKPKESKGEKLADITDPIRAANVFFDETRAKTIHIRGIDPRAHIEGGITASVRVTASVVAQVIHADGTLGERRESRETEQEHPASSAEPTIKWRWYFEDLPPAVEEKDVVTLSEEHVTRLESFLSEGESVLPSS